jgi:hypothetical protein
VLELRPICENCGVLLPPDSLEARICSFECTFCRSCVDDVLANVCPNCGGGFCPRPIRPKQDWEGGNSIATYPATVEQRHRPVDAAAHELFARPIRSIIPERR